MSDVVHGLYITGLGMGLVFLTLGAILLLMVLLVRLFPSKAAKESPAPAAPVATDLEQEKVAAISVALARALLEDRMPPAVGRGSAAGQDSSWAAAGRQRQLNQPRSREKTS